MSNERICTIPDSIDWPGRGVAHRVPSQGPDDYRNTGYNAVYVTNDGAMLVRMSYYVKDLLVARFQAKYKGSASSWHNTPEEAIAGWVVLNT